MYCAGQVLQSCKKKRINNNTAFLASESYELGIKFFSKHTKRKHFVALCGKNWPSKKKKNSSVKRKRHHITPNLHFIQYL